MFSIQTCFTLSLRSLGFIIAITSIIYSGVKLINFVIIYHTLKKAEQVTTEGGDVLAEDSFFTTMSILLFCARCIDRILTLIVCPLLLLALIKKKPGLMFPWLIYWAASVIFHWVACVVVAFHMMVVDTVICAALMHYIVYGSMGMGLFLALWVAMLSLRREMKNENTS